MAEKSPVENLPVAAGKRRRGRPRKNPLPPPVQGGTTAAATSPQVAAVGAVIAQAVKTAVMSSLAKRAPADPLSRSAVAQVASSVARSELRKLVQDEVANARPDLGTQSRAEVRDVIADASARDVLSTDHGQGNPHWHLLRNR
jgi:hypothetical protein